MSIIHDALKKVQASTPQHPPAAPDQPQPPVNGEPAAEHGDNFITPLWITALCAIVAIFAIATSQLTPKNTPLRPKPARVTLPQAAPQLPSPEKAPAPLQASPAVTPPAPAPVTQPAAQQARDMNDPLGTVRIEGVMDMGGKKAILINGNIYEAGQMLYGRTIVDISFDTLTVMENGQKRTLPIRP